MSKQQPRSPSSPEGGGRSIAPRSADKSSSRPQGPTPTISSNQIVFAISARHKQSEACFSIRSSAGDPHYAYKVKTTAPKRFCVWPNQGTIAPGQTIEVTVSLCFDKILQECYWESQSEAFNFSLIAKIMRNDKFLVQSVALNEGEEEYPNAQAVQFMQDALTLEQQGNKAEAEVAKSKADEAQHQHWDSFKFAKRVVDSVDSKISLNFVDASRTSSTSAGGGGAIAPYSAAEGNAEFVDTVLLRMSEGTAASKQHVHETLRRSPLTFKSFRDAPEEDWYDLVSAHVADAETVTSVLEIVAELSGHGPSSAPMTPTLCAGSARSAAPPTPGMFLPHTMGDITGKAEEERVQRRVAAVAAASAAFRRRCLKAVAAVAALALLLLLLCRSRWLPSKLRRMLAANVLWSHWGMGMDRLRGRR